MFLFASAQVVNGDNLSFAVNVALPMSVACSVLPLKGKSRLFKNLLHLGSIQKGVALTHKALTVFGKAEGKVLIENEIILDVPD